ncbi:MAG TPA: type II toxin-antitoxin system VapC family toxin [Beijerinckiaceae bacterium]|jgi:predicted nucleic-acid-binding protein
MIGIDTNVLLRMLLDDDPDHSPRAVRFLKHASASESVVINPIVLAEATWTLARTYKSPRQEIAGKVEEILETGRFEVLFADAAARAVEEYRTGRAEYADYLLAHINAEFGCRTTFTFDQDAARSRALSPVP